MKKILTSCFIVVVFICSCKTKKVIAHNKEDNFVDLYKSAVFAACLDETTGNDFKKFLNTHNDVVLSAEFDLLNYDTFIHATNKGKAFSATIEPIAHLDNRVPGYRDCFRYAMSREIDSIARVEYKKSKE